MSDITYVRTLTGFSYLSLITDAYSRKITGYALYETPRAAGPTEALLMAIKGRAKISAFILIHHSDSGVQYCSSEYVEILTKANIAISMTQSDSPYDNALAERVNGRLRMISFPKKYIKIIRKPGKMFPG